MANSKNNKVKISCIITTFNRSAFVKKAIESVLAQTYKNFELLVLDNESKDETEEVVKKFKDKRISYIKHKPLGISEARNLGIRKSKGDYIAFLDDDDEWLTNKLKDQIEVFKKGPKEIGLVYGGFIKIDNDGNVLKKHHPQLKGSILKELLSQEYPFTASASNPMIRKDVFREIGYYNKNILTGEDWELYLRLAEKLGVDYTPKIVLKIRQHHGERLGDKIEEAAKLEIFVLKKYKKYFDEDARLKSFYLQRIGGKFCRLGKFKVCRNCLNKAIKINRFNYLAYIQYVFSLFGRSFYTFMHNFYKKITR